jgi:hypothetical protein
VGGANSLELTVVTEVQPRGATVSVQEASNARFIDCQELSKFLHIDPLFDPVFGPLTTTRSQPTLSSTCSVSEKEATCCLVAISDNIDIDLSNIMSDELSTNTVLLTLNGQSETQTMSIDMSCDNKIYDQNYGQAFGTHATTSEAGEVRYLRNFNHVVFSDGTAIGDTEQIRTLR